MIKAEDNITLKSTKSIYDTAQSAQQIAGNTNQYFWHTASGTDTGAHITEKTQEAFLADPANGGGNLLARSTGIAVRDGLTELAVFGADGMRIGKTTEKNIQITNEAFNVFDEDGSNPFAISTTGSLKTETSTWLTTVNGTSDTNNYIRRISIYLRGAVQNNRFYVGVSTSGAPTSYTQYIENPTSTYKSITVDGVKFEIKTIEGNNIYIQVTNTTNTHKYTGVRFTQSYRDTLIKANGRSLSVGYDVAVITDSKGVSAKSLIYTYGHMAMIMLFVYNSSVTKGSVLYSGSLLNYLPVTPTALVGQYLDKLVTGSISTSGTIRVINMTGGTISPTASAPAMLYATYIFQ